MPKKKAKIGKMTPVIQAAKSSKIAHCLPVTTPNKGDTLTKALDSAKKLM